MSEKSNPNLPKDPREWKIFPRNLTARADTIVVGNPASSRPESGVDNCYPGLEMDARNIQKHFFPGTYFEVYRNDGALLRELTPAAASPWQKLALKTADLDSGVFLWGMKGRLVGSQDPNDPPSVDFVNQSGLYAWRKARDLFRGRVGIVIGPGVAEEGDALVAAMAKLEELWAEGKEGHVQRENETLSWAVLLADRSSYLNADGVLSPEVYSAGEFTRTLCTPWTFDFRDCQCFYWASNKPDVVASEDGRYEYLNFQRKNRSIEPQTEDIAMAYNARRQQEIDYAPMMEDWEQLRPVLNGREFSERYTPARAPSGSLLTFEQIVMELTYLAAVEHALAVQYLYAYYSVGAPPDRPVDPKVQEFGIWSAANEIFEIAIDEMRHFRWANEVLKLLGAPTTAKRGETLGRTLDIPFYLQGLSSPQLQWFIDVERPSRSTVAGLDGMYVGVLESIRALERPELSAENRRRAVETIKLIVDEGESHYLRFSRTQQNLAFFDDAGRGELPSYVRKGWREKTKADVALPFDVLYGVPLRASSGSREAGLQDKSDRLYNSLLMLLKIVFAMKNPVVSGENLRRAIGLMTMMNSVNFDLAEAGATALFTLPDGWGAEPPCSSANDARDLLKRTRNLLKGLEVAGTQEPKSLGGRPALSDSHDFSIEEIVEGFEKSIEQSEY